MEIIGEKSTETFFNSLMNKLRSHQKTIIITVISIVAVILIVSLSILVVENINKRDFKKIENYYHRVSLIPADLENEAKISAINEIITEINSEIKNLKGFSAARLWDLLGNLYVELEQWSEAGDAWSRSAAASPNSFMAASSLYNAAIAAEEQGDNEAAIKLYERIIDKYSESFALASRAMFKIAVLSEIAGQTPEALKAYKDLINEWPESGWTKYANSRIIILEGINL